MGNRPRLSIKLHCGGHKAHPTVLAVVQVVHRHQAVVHHLTHAVGVVVGELAYDRGRIERSGRGRAAGRLCFGRGIAGCWIARPRITGARLRLKNVSATTNFMSSSVI